MDYQKLKQEIDSGPLAAECVGKTDTEIAELLNAMTGQMVQTRFITARTILAELPDAANILDKLDAVAANIPSVKWAMRYLIGETGIDIGHPGTRQQIEALQTAGVLTADEATGLLNMAVFPASRTEIIGLGAVSAGDVSRAQRGPY